LAGRQRPTSCTWISESPIGGQNHQVPLGWDDDDLRMTALPIKFALGENVKRN
jgi:hypothetical protein